MASPEIGASIPDSSSGRTSEKKLEYEYDWDYHDINHSFPLRTFHGELEYDDSNHSIPPMVLRMGKTTAAERARRNVNAKLANPLAGINHTMLEAMGAEYARKHQIGDSRHTRRWFEKGAVLAQDPTKYASVPGLTEEERRVLDTEHHQRWHQPPLLYCVIIICSTCAAVQGMDQTVVNGAQLFYKGQFGLGGTDPRSTWLIGLLNSAPYLCCAFLGCWLTVPFNSLFGRRGTIFLTCLFSVLACFWQAFTNTWWHMFVARFFLGFGIGPKSATVPIFAAETTPPRIRGALVMQWQMWTAFGIMLGYAADLCFYRVVDRGGAIGLNWRLMMASAMLPALVVVVCIFMCPESPRWYMSKGRHYKAYQSMCRLRHHEIQAARDIFYMHTLLEAETDVMHGRNKFIEIIAVPRNRRAMIASELVMFLQQFCGVNIISYYSSQIFLDGGFSPISALSASFGFGLINWIFAIPAIYTIDTFGRRNLLLVTYPFLCLFLCFTGFSFFIPHGSPARLACISLGIYLFGIVYSPGEGPVPFTYSAEAYPLYVRAHGMSLATATTWTFNAALSLTWPAMQTAFTIPGAFLWYAGWNVVGFFLVLTLLPETKGKTLEELDQVFSVPSKVHAAYGLRQLRYFVKRYVMRRKIQPEQLYEHEDMRDRDRGFDLDDEKGM